jgi:hypothetical protein
MDHVRSSAGDEPAKFSNGSPIGRMPGLSTHVDRVDDRPGF